MSLVRRLEWLEPGIASSDVVLGDNLGKQAGVGRDSR